MNTAIKGLIVMLCLLFLVMGGPMMFDPAASAGQLFVTPEGPNGLNTIRGDLGGLFLGTVVMLVMGLVRGETVWFLAVAVLMGLIATGRAVGFVIDGYTGDTLLPFLVEIGIVGLMIMAHKRLPAS